MKEDTPVEGFGKWYDLRQGDEGDLWHRTLIDPGLFSLIGKLPTGIRVLDVGCGNGYISRRLAQGGAHVVGVDASPELIERATRRENAHPLGIVYHRMDAAHMEELGDTSFDLAIANMSLLDIEDADGAIREIARLVRPGGRFVFSISHPCFDVDTSSAWSVEGSPEHPIIFRKVAHYREPHSDRFEWSPKDGFRPTTVGYHRPLNWYAHALRKHGWSIVDMEEPRPLPGYVGRNVAKEWIDEIPMHLIVEARRGTGSADPKPQLPWEPTDSERVD